ncbi:MAG: RDD family protein [Flammeovirgaceae bacterium]|nr:RDD family protein [Flammeovirgaceae bacterium]
MMNESILDAELADNSEGFENVEYAGFWIRVGASLIDFLVLLPVVGLGIYNMLSIKSMLLMLVLTIAGAIYKPYFEWKKGATIGKSAVGIKVVNMDLMPITLNQVVARYFPWIINYALSLILDFYLFSSPEFNSTTDFVEIGLITEGLPLEGINRVYSFIFLIMVGSLIFDKFKQGVHDKAAKTYCIKSN